MNWMGLIPILLKVVVWIVQTKLDDLHQRQLGRDEEVRKSLEVLNERVAMAQQIDQDSSNWSPDTVDDKLRGKFREDRQ